MQSGNQHTASTLSPQSAQRFSVQVNLPMPTILLSTMQMKLIFMTTTLPPSLCPEKLCSKDCDVPAPNYGESNWSQAQQTSAWTHFYSTTHHNTKAWIHNTMCNQPKHTVSLSTTCSTTPPQRTHSWSDKASMSGCKTSTSYPAWKPPSDISMGPQISPPKNPGSKPFAMETT